MAYLKHGQLSIKTNGTRVRDTVRDGVSFAWFDSTRAQGTQPGKESQMESEMKSVT